MRSFCVYPSHGLIYGMLLPILGAMLYSIRLSGLFKDKAFRKSNKTPAKATAMGLPQRRFE
ncbi:hypothetical protein DQG13_14245 [Paenibacillus sp. YN15]|nr:hypothetical protein DQG13_14245 [Paenibacillus sp. YN15]